MSTTNFFVRFSQPTLGALRLTFMMQGLVRSSVRVHVDFERFT
jgi:hypothetical protein